MSAHQRPGVGRTLGSLVGDLEGVRFGPGDGSDLGTESGSDLVLLIALGVGVLVLGVAIALVVAARRRAEALTGHRHEWTRWSPDDAPGFPPTPRHEDEDLGLAVTYARHCRGCRLMQTRDHSLPP